MMTIKDIKRLIANGEHRRLELKKTTGELKDAMHSACAFLNSDGGWLLFGITPNSLNIVGQQVSDRTQQEIASALAGLEPAVDVKVEYIDVPNYPGNKVIAMFFDAFVPCGTPYTFHGCPYYKVENTTIVMPRAMFEQRIRECDPRKFAWDTQIANEYTIEDLSEERIRGAVRLGVMGGRLNASADGDDVTTLLRKLKLLKGGKPTRAAVVLFAKNTDEYPQILLRMACFKGNDKSEFIDNKMITGNFFDLLDAAMDFCFRHLSLGGRVVGLRREERLEVPQEALREALVNALCHRFYERPNEAVSLAIYNDRIEINNPGRFPHQLNTENIKLPHESYPYNRLIAKTLFLTTYLESWGSGVKRMLDLCKGQNLPEPYYAIEKDIVGIVFKRYVLKGYGKISDTMTFCSENQDWIKSDCQRCDAKVWCDDSQNDSQKCSVKGLKCGTKVCCDDSQSDSQSDSQNTLSERERFILAIIKDNPRVSAKQISLQLRVSVPTIYREIKKINQTIRVFWQGSPKTGSWIVENL